MIIININFWMSKLILFNPLRPLFYLFVLSFIFIFSCKTTSSKVPAHLAQHVDTSALGMVVSAHELSSKIGAEILKQGGNAVDAAVATQFALAVCYPRAGNLGGGGFMVIKDGNQVMTLDYRERAPQAAHRDVYLDSLGHVNGNMSLLGPFASGVPGSVYGLLEVWDSLGEIKDLKKIIGPSIDLAKNGYALTPAEVDRLRQFQSDFKKYAAQSPFVKSDWSLGDTLYQKLLAQTLEKISDHGSDVFYKGEIAKQLVAYYKSYDEWITSEDLNSYSAVWRPAIHTSFYGYDVYGMGPPSSGGIAIAQLLKMYEMYKLDTLDADSDNYLQFIIEFEKRVFADRAAYLGDEDFVEVPVEMLLSPSHLNQSMSNFSPGKPTAVEAIMDSSLLNSEKLHKEHFETTHTSVVDANGMAVSVTTTLNSNFGSKVWIPALGFFMNNEMDDFVAKAGVPNQFGLVGAEANQIEAGKRMLSSMSPTIVSKDDQVQIVVGSPGGSTIITTVFQIILNRLIHGMPAHESIWHKRFHHQCLPNVVMYENNAIDRKAIHKLIKMGYELESVGALGLAKGIFIDSEHQVCIGVGDNRSEDWAEGVK